MKRWYVVQVYAGYEDAVKADILKRIEERELQERFGEALIPAAKLRQFFEAADTKDQQLFPGYILIEMEMAPETMRAVNSSHRVLRFMAGMEPAPLSTKDIDRILYQMRGEMMFGKVSQ